MSFEVHVVDDDGDGIDGIRVTLSFTSLLRGMTGSERTDSDGSAYFDGYEDGEVDVFIDGSNYGTYRYEDGGCVNITK